jgi:DNA-binding MarR family transcriptional regulator
MQAVFESGYQAMTNPERNAETDLSDPVEPAAWPYEALKRFRLIFRAVQQHAQSVESSLGVSSAQLWAMSELSECPGLKVAELAEAMSVHQSTISNLMARLEKKGLIRRERSDPDLRVVRLYLTEEGRSLMARAPAHRQGLLQHALFELPDPVLVMLVQNLDRLIEAMEITDREAALQPLSVSGTANTAADTSSTE